MGHNSTDHGVKELNKQVHENRKFKCYICLKVFSSKYSVKDHISCVHEGYEKYVSKSWGQKSQVHEKNKPIQCPQCPTRFGFKGEFNRHFVNVHGGKGLNSHVH